MTYEYNPERIQKAVARAAKTRNACKKIARIHLPALVGAEVAERIGTRRKLYNFLEALDLSHEAIKSIFWSYNLAVPRDRSLIPRKDKKEEQKPSWLNCKNEEIFFSAQVVQSFER